MSIENTLLLHPMKISSGNNQKLIKHYIEKDGIDHLEEIQSIIKKTKSFEYTLQKANKEIAKAKDCLLALPVNKFSIALNELAELAVQRES